MAAWRFWWEEPRRCCLSVSSDRAAVSSEGLYANAAPLLGHGAVRAAVVGRDARPPTDDELAEMRRLVSIAMEGLIMVLR